MPVAIVWQFLVGLVFGVVCLGLFVLGFVRPGHSRAAERDVTRSLAALEAFVRRTSALPTALAKPFRRSRRAARKSAQAGRKARKKAES